MGEMLGSRNTMLVLFPHKIADYTLRDLRDAMQNIQLHWSKPGSDGINLRKAVDACFHRFGILSSQLSRESIMNDQVSGISR